MNLQAAYELHQAGRYADAARTYQALLERDPDDADVLHLFGVMHHQCGYSARAAELTGRAVELRPQVAAYRANLAEIQRALGQHEQAAESCRTALRLQPDYPEALNNLGLALHDLGRHEEAIAQFDAALAVRPDFAMAQNNRGTALRALGKPAEAQEAYQAAIALDEKLTRAHANLGQMFADEGRLAEGLVHCRDAVRHGPELPEAHNNLGNVLRGLERWADAADAYAEAVRLQPGLAVAHANLGLVLRRLGRPDVALTHLRRAAELDPEDDATWLQLAYAHGQAEDWAAAIAVCERRAAKKPGDADAHTELGWAYQSDNRHAEAEASFRRALELEPDHLDARVNLGELHEELGAMKEAEACYREAEVRHPRSPLPLARRAVLVRGKLPEADRDRLRYAMYGPTAPNVRLNLLFALAHVADARGEYAEAAACLEPANAMARELRQSRHQPYDLDQHTRFVDRLMATFTPERMRQLHGLGDDSVRPVFVFGMPRSGTTLTEQVLASHSQVFGAGELPLAHEALDALPSVVGRLCKPSDDKVGQIENPSYGEAEDVEGRPDKPARGREAEDLAAFVEALGGDGLRQLARTYQDGVQKILDRQAPGRQPVRVVDKMPDNYLCLGLIALLFPRATLIYVKRDARDVAVSCWMTHFRSIRWADDLDSLAGRVLEHRRLMAHWQAVLPVPMHEVCYEQLVDDFEPEARRLVAACGLEWEPACLEFHQTARPVRTASVTQVRQPLYRKALARWKHYEPYLGEFFKRLPPEQESGANP
jgi:tetratricopeptide (TPR) repeat protein